MFLIITFLYLKKKPYTLKKKKHLPVPWQNILIQFTLTINLVPVAWGKKDLPNLKKSKYTPNILTLLEMLSAVREISPFFFLIL